MDFLLVLIKLFFAKRYRWVATSEKRSKMGDFAPTRSVWSKFQVDGVAPIPKNHFCTDRPMNALQLYRRGRRSTHVIPALRSTNWIIVSQAYRGVKMCYPFSARCQCAYIMLLRPYVNGMSLRLYHILAVTTRRRSLASTARSYYDYAQHAQTSPLCRSYSEVKRRHSTIHNSWIIDVTVNIADVTPVL